MNTFWISNENAKGPGFGLFSPTHLSVLCILALVSFLICRAYRNASPSGRNKIRVTLAVIIVAEEVLKDMALFATGQFTDGNWPFQLCGLGIFIVAYDAWRRNKTSHELLYALTLPGALMALLTPDWVTNHFLDFFVFQSFTIHTFLVTYVLMQLIAREWAPDFRQLWRVLLFLVIAVPIAKILNILWTTNFFYLEIPVVGSPLQPVHQIFGNFYLLGMALLVMVFWFFMYLPWAIYKARKPHLTVKE